MSAVPALQKAVFDPPDQIRTVFYERIYPRVLRPEDFTEPELPPEFNLLPDGIMKMLPFSKIPANEQNQKPMLYQAYDQSKAVLGQMFDQSIAFLGEVVRSNIEVRTDWYSSKFKYEIMHRQMDRWAEELQGFKPAPRRVLNAELATQQPIIIKTRLEQGLREIADGLVKEYVKILDHMVDLEQVGLISWKAADVCRYSYYRHIFTQRQTNVRLLTTESSSKEVPEGNIVKRQHQQTKTFEHDLERTQRIARHIHEVVEAQPAPVTTTVPKPARVVELFKHMPAWVAPIVRIVIGQEIYHSVVEEEIEKEQLTDKENVVTTWEEEVYRYDPAVTMGHYVLTGWTGDEK